MKFGEKLKTLRHDKGLTQPEMAEAIGIEQSYLSKLENDKSLPSKDTFVRILEVFGLGVADVVDELDQSSKNQLRQLPEVADYYNQEKLLIIGNRKRWLLVSAVLVSFGAAFIYAGSVNLFFSDMVYQYMSPGVVHEGESKGIFADPAHSVPSTLGAKEEAMFVDSINARLDEQYIVVSDFRGDIYSQQVAGGSRTYYLSRSLRIFPWQNKLVIFIGIVMAALGVIGLALEQKLSRYH
ncbi:MAG: helix-turn-helix domain-containing protein [Gammaproteobacteria bacterium]|nr:helix-turn-helix domain-containing protein [Gammaproteobacteria bacterium]MCZ6854799.1 helix-turn-helix domain-containing protein [Gammaproteobacteria bacterium]